MKVLLFAFLTLGSIIATPAPASQQSKNVSSTVKDVPKVEKEFSEANILDISWRKRLTGLDSKRNYALTDDVKTLRANETRYYPLRIYKCSGSDAGWVLKQLDGDVKYYIPASEKEKIEDVTKYAGANIKVYEVTQKRDSRDMVTGDYTYDDNKPLSYRISLGTRIISSDSNKYSIDDKFKKGEYLELTQVLPVQVGKTQIDLHLEEGVGSSWYQYKNNIQELLPTLKAYIKGKDSAKQFEQEIELFAIDDIQNWTLTRYSLEEVPKQKIGISFSLKRDKGEYKIDSYSCEKEAIELVDAKKKLYTKTYVKTLPMWDDKIQYKVEFDKDVKSYVLVNTETKAKYYIEVLRQNSGLKHPEKAYLGTCSYSDLDKFRRFEKSTVDTFPIQDGKIITKPVTFEINPVMPAGTSTLLGYFSKPYLAISKKP